MVIQKDDAATKGHGELASPVYERSSTCLNALNIFKLLKLLCYLSVSALARSRSGMARAPRSHAPEDDQLTQNWGGAVAAWGWGRVVRKVVKPKAEALKHTKLQSSNF